VRYSAVGVGVDSVRYSAVGVGLTVHLCYHHGVEGSLGYTPWIGLKG
jgi:hypothetical protein